MPAVRPIAFLGARLVDPESGYDGQGALLVEHVDGAEARARQLGADLDEPLEHRGQLELAGDGEDRGHEVLEPVAGQRGWRGHGLREDAVLERRADLAAPTRDVGHARSR